MVSTIPLCEYCDPTLQVSLGKEETYLTLLAIRNLVAEKNLQSVRLFGKIFGSGNDYLVVESERRPEDDESEEAEEPAAPAPAANEFAKPTELADDEMPTSTHKPNPPIPKEAGTGVNRYVYYVCNYPGAEWTRLPDATPAHIQTARKIRKAFTGNLDAKIVSHPPFHGTEAHYLRAQIARIAATTVVSPNGYYKFDEEEEPEEGGKCSGLCADASVSLLYHANAHCTLCHPCYSVRHGCAQHGVRMAHTRVAHVAR